MYPDEPEEPLVPDEPELPLVPDEPLEPDVPEEPLVPELNLKFPEEPEFHLNLKYQMNLNFR